MKWYFGLFVVSGFCSILYEVIWLRSAMAQFGVTTPIVSLVLSAFMIGLGVGSYAAGYIVRKYGERLGFPVLRLYALTELLIGISATTVPIQFLWGREILLKLVYGMSFSSWAYFFPAGIWIALTLVPWCACMGATFPFAMAAIRQMPAIDSHRSFSYLYLANVLGAVTGATVPLVLIEFLGFHRTLLVGSGFNVLLAACALCLSFTLPRAGVARIVDEPVPRVAVSHTDDRKLLWLLFGTGLTSMGAEVVWVRIYTPSLGTVVYAFAAILAIYLASTYLGSAAYRTKPRTDILDDGGLWILFGISVLFAFLTADPRIPMPGVVRAFLGIAPFAFAAGFITPMVLDRYSEGDPDRAGAAYAVNIGGCMLGPLIAGFLLLPWLGERFALCLFALPWLIAGLRLRRVSSFAFRNPRTASAFCVALAVLSIACTLWAKGYEEQFQTRWVRRDSTATVIATGSGRAKRLLVNGVGMTQLTPVTKMMVHFPLALLSRPPEKGLVICFGMGTSELAMLSWGIDATAVELVPSVPRVVTFFHPEAKTLLQTPRAHIVVDDGRAYLERSSEQFDVITTDPPPPLEAAGSSLLYSKEFYAIAKRHLRPGGILQEWFPGGDRAITASAARAISESFPYVRAFSSVEGWGIHYLASTSPIPDPSATELVSHMPAGAVENMMEWGPASDPIAQFHLMLDHEITVSSIIEQDAAMPPLQDDRPVNEYFLFRRLSDPAFDKLVWHFVMGH